jgi:hypothetical protein
VAVAGTGSWFLILSRLGDQHPLPYTLTTATTLLAVTLARSPHRRWRASLCGALAAAGWYAYGATFLLPLLAAVIVWREWAQRRIPARSAAAFAFALAIAAVPIAWSSLGHLDVLRGGHFARAAAVDPVTIPSNLLRGLLAFWQSGDGLSRVNPGRLPHVDPVSGIARRGIVWWLLPSRRERGRRRRRVPADAAAVDGCPEQVPSAGRTSPRPVRVPARHRRIVVAAGGARARLVAAARAPPPLLTLVAGLNLLRYFVEYRRPAVAQRADRASLADYVDRPPRAPGLHRRSRLGSSVPRAKSVRYTIADGSRVAFERR